VLHLSLLLGYVPEHFKLSGAPDSQSPIIVKLLEYFRTSLFLFIFSPLALQPPLGVVFYSPLVGFSLLAYEVS